jgi:hypothetical protein
MCDNLLDSALNNELSWKDLMNGVKCVTNIKSKVDDF